MSNMTAGANIGTQSEFQQFLMIIHVVNAGQKSLEKVGSLLVLLSREKFYWKVWFEAESGTFYPKLRPYFLPVLI